MRIEEFHRRRREWREAMSAGDNELDYLHVPRNPIDRAITELEAAMKEWFRHVSGPTHYGPLRETEKVFHLTIQALRALDRGKRERY